MDQATSERRFARCSQLWAAARGFRQFHTPEVDKAARRNRTKPNTQTVLKGIALTATLAAAATLGHQIANDQIRPATVIFTALAVLGTSLALASDIRRILNTARQNGSTR